MTRLHRAVNLVAVVVPFLAFLAAVPLLWQRLVSWTDLAILAVMYVLSVGSVTVGFHRLLTHRSFATYRVVEYAFAVLGCLAIQGPVISWVSDHRKHHAHTDREGDPHSPHLDHGSGLRGLWHAHVGWILSHDSRAQAERYAPELVEDPVMRAINRCFAPLAVASLILPFALGWMLGGGLRGALTAFFWGSLVRVFFVHHVTWSTNSVCHFFGQRRFVTEDKSTNVFWLALPSLGEAWHHNHHAFPRSARHGLRWYEVDPSGVAIRVMERLGLAWNVVTIPADRQRQRMLSAPAIASTTHAAVAPRVNALVYWAVRGLVEPFVLIRFRLQRIGAEQIPRTGPLILAANHRSNLDPFLIGILVRRPVYYMAKKELFRAPWQAWILSALGAFPVDRGAGDAAALDTARRILERGDCLVMFPEGARQRSGPLGRPHRGVGRLALETGAPVVPVALLGTEAVRKGRRLRRYRLHVHAGAAVSCEPAERLTPDGARIATEHVWARITLQWARLGGAMPEPPAHAPSTAIPATRP